MVDTDLKRAYDTLTAKSPTYTALFAYADGNQPLRYSTDRLREAFDDITTYFAQNWCEVVVQSLLDRLALKGFDAEDKSINTRIDDLWTRMRLELDAYDVHEAALITGESYLIIWPAEDGETEAYYNDPRMCHVFYDAARPKVKQFAAKWWDADGIWHMTLYYPDRLEYYEARQKDQPNSAGAFQPSEPPQAPNPYDIIPVFHFRTNRRKMQSELSNVISLQDAVNKLLADMMVTAEYNAFPQRWIISNADTTDLKNGPNELWTLPAGDGQGQASSAGQFAAAELANYLDAIDRLAASIAIITRTPKHYFYGTGSNLSGEALLAMESPLTKKVLQRQEIFSVTWSEAAAFLLRLDGVTVDPASLATVWAPPESTQPLTEAQTIQTMTSAGIPLKTAVSRRGWAKDEIDQMTKDEQEAQTQRTSMAQALLTDMRNRDAQMNEVNNAA